MHREGAELAFTYQNERLLKNLKPIASECGSDILIECDVSNDDSISSSFVELSKNGKNLMALCILLVLPRLISLKEIFLR